MPKPPHELAVVALKEQPAVAAELLELLTGVQLGELHVVDSALRFPAAAEARPDLCFESATLGPAIIEVQHAMDPAKPRIFRLQFALATVDERRPARLFVLTQSRAVARWVERSARLVAADGLEVRLPIFPVLLDETVVPRLLDPAHPALAFFAAWSVRHRRGPRALEVVEQAVALTERLPEP